MTDEQRRALEIQTLKDRSPFAIPNNPSQSGWSTAQIKEKFYTGLLYLYDLFYSLRGSVEESLTEQNDIVQQVYEAMQTAIKNKGSVATYADLPTNPEFGDTYNVEENGDNYMWNGTFWDKLAGEYYTKLETIALIALKENPITAGEGLSREGDTISSLLTATNAIIDIKDN